MTKEEARQIIERIDEKVNRAYHHARGPVKDEIDKAADRKDADALHRLGVITGSEAHQYGTALDSLESWADESRRGASARRSPRVSAPESEGRQRAIYGELGRELHIGDHVSITKGRYKGDEGTITHLASGPHGDMVSVQLLNPVQAMLGPAIIDPRHVYRMGRSGSVRAPRSAPAPKREAEAGFAIGVYDQRLIEENIEDHFGDRGDVDDRERALRSRWIDGHGRPTRIGWDQLNTDIARLERNALAWMRSTFNDARDEGHDAQDDLIGTFWFDPANSDHAYLVSLAADGNERIDMTDSSYGDLANTAFDGVSDFGASVLGGAINFFNVKPEDMEAIEETLERQSKPRRSHR